MPSDPAFQVYAKELMYMARGTPLWVPESRRTADGKIMAEIELGDVGYIKGGEFFRLFSTASPKNAPVNSLGGVPKGFEQFKINEFTTSGLDKVLDPGPYQSTTVRSFAGGIDAKGDHVVEGGFTYSCTKKQGALLILKDKAIHKSINDLSRVDTYIKRHMNSWYAFVSHHGLRVSMGDLVMVTGFDKTSSWALAAFTERSETAAIHFGAGLSPGNVDFYIKGDWGRQESVQARSGPPDEHRQQRSEPKYDQCIFIQVSKPSPLAVWKAKIVNALESDYLAVDIVGKHMHNRKNSDPTDILVAHDVDWIRPLQAEGRLGDFSAGPGDFFSHLYKVLDNEDIQEDQSSSHPPPNPPSPAVTQQSSSSLPPPPPPQQQQQKRQKRKNRKHPSASRGGQEPADAPITNIRSDTPMCKDLSGEIELQDSRPIAVGGYADIYIGELRGDRVQIQKVAIKVFRGIHIVPSGRRGIERRLIREANLWSLLAHPNVLPFLGVCKDIMGTTSLISPFCAHGSVSHYLTKDPNCDRFSLVTQATTGLVYLHEKGINHGDLTSSNILILDDKTACLTDFGRSRIVNDSDGTNPAIAGSIRYSAPEILGLDDVDEPSPFPLDFQAADVYSLAMVMLEILTGKLPFYWTNGGILLATRVLGGMRPSRARYESRWLTGDVWACIEGCWDTNPIGRPKAASVLSRLQECRSQFC